MSDIHEDIYQGLENQPAPEKPLIFSLGHRCTSSSLIKELKLKFESYPFDWVVSKLDVVANCIETDFSEFLNQANYETMESETFNLCDREKKQITTEKVVYNKFYEDQAVLPNDLGTYGMQLCMSHHDIRTEDHLGYFERCVRRFRSMLASDKQKYYLHIHPLTGPRDYSATTLDLQKYFLFFTEYFKTKTVNSFGIYFMLVQNDEKKGQVELVFQNEDCIIYTLYANSTLIDGGGVFCGDSWYDEQYKLLTTIEKHINS